MGNGPAWRPGHVTQRLAVGQVINLVNHAIDVIGQVRPAGEQPAVVVQAMDNTLDHPHFRIHRQAPVAEALQQGAVGGRQRLGGVESVAVAEKVERPVGRHAGVQLAEAAGRRVAGVGKGLFPGGQSALVQVAKTPARHEDLAADLEPFRPAVPG